MIEIMITNATLNFAKPPRTPKKSFVFLIIVSTT